MTKDPMEDFIRGLDSELRAAGARENQRSRAGRIGRDLRSRPAGAGIATAGGVAMVTAAIAISSSGTNTATAAAMPVFERAAITGDGLVDRLMSDVRIRGDVRQGRAIEMAGGTGYFVPGEGGQAWCLTQPDPEVPHPEVEYGVTCATKDAVLNEGISIIASGRDVSYYAAVVPAGVNAPKIDYGDHRGVHSLEIDRGAVVAEIRENATIIESARDGGTREIPVSVGAEDVTTMRGTPYQGEGRPDGKPGGMTQP